MYFILLHELLTNDRNTEFQIPLDTKKYICVCIYDRFLIKGVRIDREETLPLYREI